jgi:hypothetical protein
MEAEGEEEEEEDGEEEALVIVRSHWSEGRGREC